MHVIFKDWKKKDICNPEGGPIKDLRSKASYYYGIIIIF